MQENEYLLHIFSLYSKITLPTATPLFVVTCIIYIPLLYGLRSISFPIPLYMSHLMVVLEF